MKNKLTIAGIVIGLIIVSMIGVKVVADVLYKYDKSINNDIIEKSTSIDNENESQGNENVSQGNEIELQENENTSLDKENDIVNKENLAKDTTYDGNILSPIAHDSDLSSAIERTIEDEVPAVDGDAAGADAIEAALNISNPNLNLDAASALLMDARTGKVIFHKNATNRVYPASTVKIMTALVALNECDKEEKITIGDEISLMAIDSSRAYLNKGEKLTLMMLLEGLLLPSGNDAAYSIATYVGRKVSKNDTMEAKDAVNVFVGLMNKKAKDLGLKNTHFMNPDGYDHDLQYTTAYDMAIIAREALNNETICKITKMQRARNIFLSGEDVTWKSGNKLIWADSGVYYKYAIGLKSGTSSLAGRCMVSAAKKEDKTYISVVMNSTAAGRWEDSLTLLRYGIEK